jgi:hypothetical protein
MTPRNVSLLTLGLLAAALCVTYVTVRPEPSPQGLRTPSPQGDIQILRDRPVGSWGHYLPRPILSKQSPTAIAETPLGSEQSTIEQFEKPKQVVEAPKEQRAAPYSSEPSRVARAPTPKRSGQALFAEDTEQLVPKRTPAKVGKPTPTTKLDGAPKKKLAGAPESRLARSATNRGLGLFALSADFGRPIRN